MHVVLAGGGTAGHIEPALALADALRRQDPTVGITALGTEKGLETRLVPERGYELALIPAVPLPRKPTPELITVPSRLRGTIRAAQEVLERTKADALVGFGGYVALPGYFAAKRRGVPLVRFALTMFAVVSPMANDSSASASASRLAPTTARR